MPTAYLHMYTYVYICIYIYKRDRERERDTERERERREREREGPLRLLIVKKHKNRIKNAPKPHVEHLGWKKCHVGMIAKVRTP